MMRITTDHNEIKRWAENHGAVPEVIDNPQREMVGIRLNLPGPQDEAFLSEQKPPFKCRLG